MFANWRFGANPVNFTSDTSPQTGKPLLISWSPSPILTAVSFDLVHPVPHRLPPRWLNISKNLNWASTIIKRLRSIRLDLSASLIVPKHIKRVRARRVQSGRRRGGENIEHPSASIDLICLIILWLSPYLLSISQQIQAVVLRRVQILRGGLLFTGINLLYVQIHFESKFCA